MTYVAQIRISKRSCMTAHGTPALPIRKYRFVWNVKPEVGCRRKLCGVT